MRWRGRKRKNQTVRRGAATSSTLAASPTTGVFRDRDDIVHSSRGFPERKGRARLRGTRATRSVRGFDVSSRGRETRSRRGGGMAKDAKEERHEGATDKRRKIKENGKADGERWVKGRGVAGWREGERGGGRVCLNQGDKGSKKQGGREGERERDRHRESERN